MTMDITWIWTVIIYFLFNISKVYSDLDDIWILPSDYTKIEYCKHKDRGHLLYGLNSQSVNVLFIDTKAIVQTYDLLRPALDLSVGPNCEDIAVSHEEYISYMKLGSTEVKYLLARTTSGTGYDSEQRLGSVIMGPHKMAYVLSGPGSQWSSRLRCVNVTSEVVKICDKCGRNLYGGPKGRLHPSNNRLYVTTSNDAMSFIITDDCLQTLANTDFTESFQFPFWYSYDGTTIFTSRGKTYESSDDIDDLKQRATFDTSNIKRSTYGYMTTPTYTWFTQTSAPPNQIYSLQSEKTNIYIYDWPYLNYVGERDIPEPDGTQSTNPLQLHADSDTNTLYVISQYNIGANTLPGVARINISEDFIKYQQVPDPEVDQAGNIVKEHEGNTVWLLGQELSELTYCNRQGVNIFIGIRKRSIYILNPNNMTSIKTVTVPLYATDIAIDSQCENAAVAHDSYVSIINLRQDPMQSITWPTMPGTLSGFVYGANEILYLWPGRGQWTDVRCLNTSDGTMGSCRCSNYGGTSAFRDPSGKYVVTLTSGLSPQSITKFKTSYGKDGSNTCLQQVQGNPDHGAYYGRQIWFSWDGNRILTDTGTLLSADSLVKKGSLPVNSDKISWVASSPKENHDIYILQKEKKWIVAYRWPFLQKLGGVTFPSPDWTTYYIPKKLFFSNEGSTLFTTASYHYKGLIYTGIGIISNITIQQESTILGNILLFNRTTTMTTPAVTFSSTVRSPKDVDESNGVDIRGPYGTEKCWPHESCYDYCNCGPNNDCFTYTGSNRVVCICAHVNVEDCRYEDIGKPAYWDYDVLNDSFIRPDNIDGTMTPVLNEESGTWIEITVGIVVPCVFIITGIVIICIYMKRKTKYLSKDVIFIPDNESIYSSSINQYLLEKRTQSFSKHNATQTYEYADLEKLWEITPEDVLIKQVLGEGAFSRIHFAHVKWGLRQIPVAVKAVKNLGDEFARRDLESEFQTLIDLTDHPNIIQLIGVANIQLQAMGIRTKCLIMEYMSHGSLLEQLRRYKTELRRGESQHLLSPRSIAKIVVDICNGMKDMESKKLLHRDLAARNVLLSGTMVAKITDFGLSRDAYIQDLYQVEKAGVKKLPLLSMAPESLTDFVYTSKSDVWSFGVLLWEIVSLGRRPYPDIEIEDVKAFVISGGRLTKPSACSSEWYSIMVQCWEEDDDKRPSFVYLHKQFTELLQQEKGFMDISVYRKNSHTCPSSQGVHDKENYHKDNNSFNEKLNAAHGAYVEPIPFIPQTIHSPGADDNYLYPVQKGECAYTGKINLTNDKNDIEANYLHTIRHPTSQETLKIPVESYA